MPELPSEPFVNGSSEPASSRRAFGQQPVFVFINVALYSVL